MDKLDTYRRILQEMIGRYAEYASGAREIETIPVFDTVHDHYLLVHLGWDQTGRVHSIPMHFRIKGGKIWAEWDGTDEELVQQLLDAGVPKEDIVLAFYHPEHRAITEFAAA